jgi:hypothetical protein
MDRLLILFLPELDMQKLAVAVEAVTQIYPETMVALVVAEGEGDSNSNLVSLLEQEEHRQ